MSNGSVREAMMVTVVKGKGRKLLRTVDGARHIPLPHGPRITMHQMRINGRGILKCDGPLPSPVQPSPNQVLVAIIGPDGKVRVGPVPN